MPTPWREPSAPGETTHTHQRTAEDGECALEVEEPAGVQRYGITPLARRQLAEKLKIPHAYFERMRTEQPELLDRNGGRLRDAVGPAARLPAGMQQRPDGCASDSQAPVPLPAYRSTRSPKSSNGLVCGRDGLKKFSFPQFTRAMAGFACGDRTCNRTGIGIFFRWKVYSRACIKSLRKPLISSRTPYTRRPTRQSRAQHIRRRRPPR